MTGRITGVHTATHCLVFSPDGRYLAATLFGRVGLRVFNRYDDWAEVLRDEDYGALTNGAASLMMDVWPPLNGNPIGLKQFEPRERRRPLARGCTH